MKTLKVNLLYNCTSKCAHCRFNCENESDIQHPDFETPYLVAKALEENFGLDIVVILGGEPTIFPDETVELIKRIKTMGVKTRLETNAWWAGSYEDAAAFLHKLDGTQTNVMFSLDGFHEPYIPIEKVANAIQASIDLGVNYNLELPYLDVKRKDNKIDQKTEELFEQLTTRFHINIPKYEGGIVFTGQAAENFGEEFAKGRGIPKEVCSKVPWWMNSEIDSLELLILEPGGYITKGCGISIVNVHQPNWIETLKNYSAYDHPIFKILLTKGPFGLAKLAEKYGYKIKENYADKCHLCHEARQVLKPYFPEILQPDQHYPLAQTENFRRQF